MPITTPTTLSPALTSAFVWLDCKKNLAVSADFPVRPRNTPHLVAKSVPAFGGRVARVEGGVRQCQRVRRCTRGDARLAWDPRAHSHGRWWWARCLVLRKHMGRSLLGAPSPATAGANPGPRVRWITDLSTATTSPGSITWPSPLLLIMFTAHVPSLNF